MEALIGLLEGRINALAFSVIVIAVLLVFIVRTFVLQKSKLEKNILERLSMLENSFDEHEKECNRVKIQLASSITNLQNTQQLLHSQNKETLGRIEDQLKLLTENILEEK